MAELAFPFLAGNMLVRKMKEGSFRFLSPWTHVSATLRRDSGNIEMFKYLADPTKAEPLWVLNMRDVVVDIVKGDDKAVQCSDCLPEFCLLIIMPNEKAFCCEIEDGIQLNQWHSCLNFVLAQFRGRPNKKTAEWIWTECGLDPSDPGNTQEQYIWEGYLEKHGRANFSLWNKRYVCVTENYLTYFDKKEVKNHRYAERLRIPLTGILEVKVCDHTSTIFEVHTKSRVYEFAAEDQKECKSWVKILNGKTAKRNGVSVEGPKARQKVNAVQLHESCVRSVAKRAGSPRSGAGDRDKAIPDERRREVEENLADNEHLSNYQLGFSPALGELKTGVSSPRSRSPRSSRGNSPRNSRASTPRRAGRGQTMSEIGSPRHQRGGRTPRGGTPRSQRQMNSGLAISPDLDMSMSLSVVSGNSFRHEGGTMSAPGKMLAGSETDRYANLAEDYKQFLESRRSLINSGLPLSPRGGAAPEGGSQRSGRGAKRSQSGKSTPRRKYRTLSVSIPQSATRLDGGVYELVGGKNTPVAELFVVYEVKVKVSGMPAWTMPCRYERFEEFHRNISDFVIAANRMPVFPSNGWFSKVPKGDDLLKFNHQTDDRTKIMYGLTLEDNPHINTRRIDLQNYLQELLSFPKIMQVGYTRKFLGLNDPKHLVDSEQQIEHVVKAFETNRPLNGATVGRGGCCSAQTCSIC